MLSKNSTEPTPSQLLALAIRKRRSVMNSKNRDIRIELLLGDTIKNLCKFIGEERAARKRRIRVCDDSDETMYGENNLKVQRSMDSERSSKVRRMDMENNSKVQRLQCSAAVRHTDSRIPLGQSTTGLSTVVSGPDRVNDEPVTQTCSVKPMDTSDDFSVSKCCRSSSADAGLEYNENDPFGLDKFFASLRTCRSSGMA